MNATAYHQSAMNDPQRIYEMFGAGPRGAQRVWAQAARQPSWVTRIAFLVFLLVVALPLLLLFLVALVLATIVFSVLALLAAGWRRFRGVLPRHDGRENVRVVQRRNGTGTFS